MERKRRTRGGRIMECENCDESFETLTRKSAYNGNKNEQWLCDCCYEEVHEETEDYDAD